MKTIEERAKDVLAQHTKQHTAIDLYSRDEVVTMLERMAEEQQSIDIDNACEWLKINYGHFDGSIEDLVADFRKAMGE